MRVNGSKNSKSASLAPEQAQLLSCLRAYVCGGKAELLIDPRSEEERAGLFSLAHAHKLLPVVCGTLSGHGELFADEVSAAWRLKAKKQAAGSALRSHEFCELLAGLESAGIEPVVLKGELLKRLYSEPHLRLSSDEDIYLFGADADACLEALRKAGFSGNEEEGGEVIALTSKSGLHIELHRGLFTDRGRLSAAGERLKEALSRTVKIGGGETALRCFAPTDELYYLICHAAKHFASCGFGVRTAADIAAYTMQYHASLNMGELERLLEESGLICFASALFDMAAKHLGYDKERFPLPFLMMDGDFTADGEAMLADCLAGGVYGKSTAERAQSAKYTSAAAKGSGSHGGTLLRALFPPKEDIAEEYPFLKKHPVLLPLAWAKRLIKYLKSGRKDAQAGAAVGRERIRLLADYGMLAEQKPAQGEKTVRRVRAAELMPVYLEAMREHGSVTVPVSGGSMSPFLTHLRDSVTLEPIGQRRIRRGDIVLYTRRGEAGEKYVMHRVVGKRRGEYVFCGDGQTEREFGVARESMLAVAESAVRKGKKIDEHSPVWLFYRHIWRVLRPLRGVILKLHSLFSGKGRGA